VVSYLFFSVALGSGCGSGGEPLAGDAGVADPDAFASCDPPALTYANFGSAFLSSYCSSCHMFNQSVVQSSGQVLASAVTSGGMPAGTHRPSSQERAEFAAWVACGAP